MSAREQMLGAIRRSLKRGALKGENAAALQRRIARHPQHIVPARTDVDREGILALFRKWATTYNCTIAEAAGPREVPALVQEYLKANNLPAQAVMADDPLLDGCDWSQAPLLELRQGLPEDKDRVAITSAFAAVAETGTMVFVSSPAHPTSLNLLPETHIVVVKESDVVGPYEEVWARLRAKFGEAGMPRTVNTVTGPSRTGDIEQTLELGAHGPRRMHVVIVKE
ncbi:MAG: lactate utilization protein C [Reyranellaceae bacterium]